MNDDDTFDDLQLALKDDDELRSCGVSRDDNVVELNAVWTARALTRLTPIVQRLGLQHLKINKNKVIVYLS